MISCELHDRMVDACSYVFHNILNGEGFKKGNMESLTFRLEIDTAYKEMRQIFIASLYELQYMSTSSPTVSFYHFL